MKVKIEERTFHGRRCIRCTARILQSKKMGIPFTRQKGWKIYPELGMTLADARTLFMPEATRWRDKIMKQIFGEQQPPAQLMQMEVL